jgi:hypothetical protein
VGLVAVKGFQACFENKKIPPRLSNEDETFVSEIQPKLINYGKLNGCYGKCFAFQIGKF